MNTLSVSKKFYADITERVNTALSVSPASAAEAMRMVDSYINGEKAESLDPLAMLAFNMIRVELDRAMSRSTRARERARKKVDIKTEEVKEEPEAIEAKEIIGTNAVEKGSGGIRLSRGERRAMERAYFGKKRKWKKL